MITKTPFTRLNEEDLAALRAVMARVDAVEVNPEAYSQAETEAAYLRYYSMMGELAGRYEVADRGFDICKFTGQIWSADE